jgi:hypothetical protein
MKQPLPLILVLLTSLLSPKGGNARALRPEPTSPSEEAYLSSTLVTGNKRWAAQVYTSI